MPQSAVVDPDDPHLDALTTAWGEEPPAHIRSEYRRLDRGARLTALARIATLQRLTRGPRPTRDDQEAAATELGLGLKRLQALMRSWARPSIAAITPGARPGSRRTPPRPGVEVARRIVGKALRRNRHVAEPSVHRRIAAVCTRLACPPPARMTVRRLLDDARRALPPPDMDWIGTDDAAALTAASGSAQPGEMLVLTMETLRARVRNPTGTEEPGRALILADAATGHVLAALSARTIGGLGRSAAAAVRNLDSSTMAVWHPLRTLVLGPPTPADYWEEAMRGRASDLNVLVTRETGRRTRRWTSSLLWRGTDELAPMTARRTSATSDLPLYDEEAFGAALAECRDTHNARVDQAVDMRMDDFRPAQSEHVEAAAHIVSALFPHDAEIGGH